MILVDTNVILDVLDDDPIWADWSQGALEAGAARDELAINDVIYAELSIGYPQFEDVEKVVTDLGLTVAAIPPAGLFLAGKAFKRYREAGGPRTGVLPDFFIGAHAAVLGVPLITRDARRYRTCFPSLVLIKP